MSPVESVARKPGLQLSQCLLLQCCCCCSADFPKTGGASLREMASEIGDNVSESLGGKSGSARSADTGAATPAQEAAVRAVENAKSE
jgi:hypothetical protein